MGKFDKLLLMLDHALKNMIFSVSGWRGVFSLEGEEGKNGEISEAHRVICGAAAFVFAEFLGAGEHQARPQIMLAADTRPTGQAIIEAMVPVLLANGCDVCYAGVCAAPEIMAWTRSERATSMEFTNTDESAVPIGFIYISASHNPIGYNGIKFGLADGGVLAAKAANKLIANFRLFIESDDNVKKIESIISTYNNEQIQALYAFSEVSKAEALRSYYEFSAGVAFGDNVPSDSLSFVHSVSSVVNKNLGIVCDFNGSARTVSIDKDFFTSLGLKFDSINGEPGQIAHRIVPEGESLEPCRQFLEEVHRRDPSFLIGYVPDCDGDRGNLVVWDDTLKRARALEAQEVFALACVAELAYMVWTGSLVYDDTGKAVTKAAVAINDPTSMRIDRIAKAFGVSVFRAEVGEANVVNLARRLREVGYTVRILGEGSAGGNITHPSAVRDPLHTVLALVKLMCIFSRAEAAGLFEIWCNVSGQKEKYREGFSLADIIASLPQFITTPAYSKDAVLQIKTGDHALLKERYQKVFEREWEAKKDKLKSKFGFYRWEAIAYNGLKEKRGISNFADAGKGGLKILFFNKNNKPCAYIWMRGSATEPVFRIMEDIDISTAVDPTLKDISAKPTAGLLLKWQRSMIEKADLTACN